MKSDSEAPARWQESFFKPSGQDSFLIFIMTQNRGNAIIKLLYWVRWHKTGKTV